MYGGMAMFRGMKERADREKSFRSALTGLLVFYPGGVSQAYKGFPKIKTAHKDEAFADASAEKAALFCARVVLTRLIEGLDADTKSKTAEEMRSVDWPRMNDFIRQYMHGEVGEPPDGQLFTTTIFGSALVVADLLLQRGGIEQDDLNDFTQEVFGALDGLNQNERTARKFGIAMHEALELPDHRADEDDTDPFMKMRKSEDLPALSGKSFNVLFRDTALGRIMVEKHTGEHITERRSLTQNDLLEVPPDSEPYRFATFQTHSGEIASCIVYGAESEVVGDMRAFWWSFAKTEVRLADMELSNRFTPRAMLALCQTARACWAEALKHDDLDSMRHDMPSYRRNVHFEAMSNIKERQATDHQAIGVRVARAMLMATQSEDRLLEQHAFNRFRDMLWLPGEEPAEYLDYI